MKTSKEVLKIIEEKVSGVWVAEHDEFGHHYRNSKTGGLVDSVTTKNLLPKDKLVPWAARQAVDWLVADKNRYEAIQNGDKDVLNAAVLQYADVRDAAGSIGHLAHDAIERYILKWMQDDSKPKDIKFFIDKNADPRVFAVARAGEQVFSKRDVVPLATELLVGSDKYNAAGTLDMLVMTPRGEIEVWDWKSSNHVNDFYACQAAAYKAFFEEMTGLKVSQCRIFKLDKNSDRFKEYIVPDEEAAFEAFIHMSKVYDWFRNRESKLEIYQKIIKI